MKINIHRETTIQPTPRTELLESMFEVPATTKLSVTLSGELNLDSKPWNIGLIVGPSGSGKTLLLNEIFGTPERLEWNRRSVIDDFESSYSMEDISRICQSVGFNTIPSWLRPYSVLSNGERFRVETARALLSDRNPVVIDEFTSVVDRGVAQFACHSIQKYVRGVNKRLVCASCHYDILDWLQPDWILEPGNPCRFTWRSLHGRPSISCKVQRVKYETWELFREFHYMSAELNRAARCYGIYVKSPTGVASGFHDEDVQTLPNGSYNNLGASERIQLPSGFGMHNGEENSILVHETGSPESVEPGFSAASSGTGFSSFLHRPSGTGNSRVRSGFERRESEAESVDSFSREETKEFARETIPKANESASRFETVSTSAESYSADHDRRSTLRNSRLAPPSQQYRIASMCGVLYRPHPRVSDIYGFTRMVTLPDFQGLGLAFVLACRVASAYKALGKRLHSYPNHPAWIRSYQRSPLWLQIKESGSFSPRRGVSSTVKGFGGRRCAVFLYVGEAMKREDAERLINVD